MFFCCRNYDDDWVDYGVRGFVDVQYNIDIIRIYNQGAVELADGRVHATVTKYCHSCQTILNLGITYK